MRPEPQQNLLGFFLREARGPPCSGGSGVLALLPQIVFVVGERRQVQGGTARCTYRFIWAQKQQVRVS